MSGAKTSDLSVAMSPLPKHSYIFPTTASAGWVGASVATGFPPFIVADQVRSDRCGVSQSGEPPFLAAVAAVDGAQSVAEPGIRAMPSTTYFWMTALDPSADLVTTQVW